jgi:hypothetical protein
MTMKVNKLALVAVLGCAAVAQDISFENSTRLARGARNAVDVQNAIREKQATAGTTPDPAPVVTPAAAILAVPAKHGPRRDPFISPIVKFGGGGGGCSVGKRCLMVSDIVVRGVVREASGGMIAVVTNSANKTYFLHDNDPLYNGVVLRITGDSVVIRESATDNLGKPVFKEVVKKIAGPA